MKRSLFSTNEHPIPRHCTGFNSYRGVIVLWDQDRDDRVLDFIDQLSEHERSLLLAIHEHKAFVDLFWRLIIPATWLVTQEMEFNGDVLIFTHHVNGQPKAVPA